MYKIITYIICLGITFGFIFPIKFVFFPLDFRILLFFFGIFCAILYRGGFSVSKVYVTDLKRLVFFNLLLVLIALLTSIANAYIDKYFFTFFMSLITCAFSSYGYIMIINFLLGKKIRQDEYLVLFLVACVIQCTISWYFFINPDKQALVYSFVSMNEMGADALERSAGTRFQGLGSNFFTAGITMSIAIIFASILIKNSKSKLKNLLYTLIALYILFVGSNMARTTQVGLIFALIYYFFCNNSTKYNLIKVVKRVLPVIIVSIVAVFVYINYFSQDDILRISMERAFSVFYDFAENKNLDSSSNVNGTFVFPNNFFTWMLGDAKMADPDNPKLAYYMGVDIGVCRTIFCLGLIGTIVFFIVQFYMIKLTRMNKNLILLFFMLFAVLMLKGMPNIINYIFPITFIKLLSPSQNEYSKYIS